MPALLAAALFAAAFALRTKRTLDHVELDSTRSHADVRRQGHVARQRARPLRQGRRHRRRRSLPQFRDRRCAHRRERGRDEHRRTTRTGSSRTNSSTSPSYPEIRFVSESFPLQRLRKGGSLSGTLTIRGIDQPATFNLAAADLRSSGLRLPDHRLGLDPALRVRHALAARRAQRQGRSAFRGVRDSRRRSA